MILCDAGPLVALIDSSDKNHRACADVLPRLSAPLLTTWPCLAVAMYLLGHYGGHRDQDRLWELIESSTILIHESTETERLRMRVLMRRYRDTPMDFADASLVAAAESLDLSRIFTTDRHFRMYRINDSGVFDPVP
jgi:predicted nucleic acid-binding protein